MIRFQCPGCRSVLQVAPSMAGAVVACSKCEQHFRVPTPQTVPVKRAEPPPPPPPPASRRGSEPPILRRENRPQARRGSFALVVGAVLGMAVLVGLAGGAAVLVLNRTKAHDDPRSVEGDPSAADKKRDRDSDGKTASGDGQKSRDAGPKKDFPAKKEGGKPAPPPDGDESALAANVLATVNARRAEAGAPALTLHEGHSRGCRDHARYLAGNLDKHPGLDPHDQADLPGATAEGKAAAAVSAIARREPADAIAAWLAAPVHRGLLLDPDRKSVGIGFAGKGGAWYTVLDWQRGGPAPKADPTGAVLYPAPRQSNVPLAFPGNEVPDPLPSAKVKLTGFPVTVTFPPRLKVTDPEASLEDESGQGVPVYFSSPQKPANDQHARLQQNTLCLFAHKPLAPGTRYAVGIKAKVNGRDWSRAWSFTTIGPDLHTPLMYRRALARFNEVRGFAGLKPVRLDAERSKGCLAHAAYLARHLDHTPGVRLGGENPDLPGSTPEGQEVAKRALVRLGGGAGPVDAVDWMLDSVLNRHLVLNPSLEGVGFGAAQHWPRGWIWVVGLSPQFVRQKDEPATLYPGRDMKDVPVYFGRPIQELVEDHPKGEAAGFAVTANFFPNAKVTGVKAELRDADGNVVDAWLSTPEAPLRGTGGYKQILLVPKKPLAAKATYTAKISAEADGRPWAREWSFTTADAEAQREAMALRLREAVNAARRWAGLGEVALDDKLSRGCRLHAKYVARNLEHRKVQGLGIHDEDMSLPGATPEGARAGKASVIAVLPDPADSVDGWMATIYHRIPLLEPSLKRIGYGQEQHPHRGWVTVLDVSGR